MIVAERHPGLVGRAPSLADIAGSAGEHAVFDDILAALCAGDDAIHLRGMAAEQHAAIAAEPAPVAFGEAGVETGAPRAIFGAHVYGAIGAAIRFGWCAAPGAAATSAAFPYRLQGGLDGLRGVRRAHLRSASRRSATDTQPFGTPFSGARFVPSGIAAGKSRLLAPAPRGGVLAFLTARLAETLVLGARRAAVAAHHRIASSPPREAGFSLARRVLVRYDDARVPRGGGVAGQPAAATLTG